MQKYCNQVERIKIGGFRVIPIFVAWIGLLFFADVPDFRLNRRKRHVLLDVLVITLLAVIYGADDCEEIALYGRQKEMFLRTFLNLPHGILSHGSAPAARIQSSP